MRSKSIAIAIGIAVVLVAVVGIWLWSRPRPQPGHAATAPAPAAAQSAASAPASAAPSSQAQLEDDIARNGVTPERAKLLFSLMVGPLPGVEIPPGTTRDPSAFDGTPAVLDIVQVWDSLTPEQRLAAARLIDKTEASKSQGGANETPRVVPAAFWRSADDKPSHDYGTMLKDADGTIAALLPQTTGVRYKYDVDYDPPEGTEFAHTSYWWQLPLTDKWAEYPDGGCHIAIHDQKFQGLDDDDARAVVTHEMFHCFQQRAEATVQNAVSVRKWVQEGEAMWVMAAVVPAGEFVIEKDWNSYIFSPKKLYSDRGQDGLGVFGHLSDLVGDEAVWSKLLPVVKAEIGGNDEDAFKLLIQGNETAYYASWGSSYFHEPNKQTWTMSGPGHPPGPGAPPDAITVDAGTVAPLSSVGPYQAQLLQLTGNADIMVIALLTGYGRAHDQGFALDTPLDTSGKLALCVKSGGCTCPDGTPGASLITQAVTAPISVGLDGGDTTAQAAVMGASLDEFCKQPDKKPPAPAPGPGGGGGGGGGGGDDQPPDARPDNGSSLGDTHITTLDGLRYDFQVVGEYTLVRSTKDDFFVQVRQVPVRNSKTVTVNQAMATKLGGHRVMIALENGRVVLRVDGKVADAPPALAGGSILRSVTMYGATYQLEWPDSTIVRVEQLGGLALNVKVKPSTARRGALAGLLGDWDGSPANDLRGAGGAALGTQPSARDVTHSLADAWRITKAASNFDYLAGQSTATFTDPTFPDPTIDPTRVPTRAAAEQRCRETGITDQRLLDDCIVDYAMTSEFLFASSYSHAQQVLAARAAIPSAATSGVLRTVIVAGTLTDPRTKPSMPFTAQAGDIIWVGHPDCTDSYIEMGLVDPSGKGISGGTPCGIGRRTLSATGTYLLRGYRTDNPVGPYHVPIRFVRPDRQKAVSYGDIIAGRIETEGAHDVFTFSGHAGDVLRISGEGCDIGNLIVGLLDPMGHDSLGPSCRVGADSRLEQTGTYQLVMNYMDGGAGTYHFVLQGAPRKDQP